jgi:hypothetical protein
MYSKRILSTKETDEYLQKYENLKANLVASNEEKEELY